MFLKFAKIIGILFLLTGCMMHHITPTGMHLRANVPGIDPAKLPQANSKQARIFTRYCSQCHNLPDPAMHTAAEWRSIVPRMVAKMRGHMTGMMARSPTADDEAVILSYLEMHAQQALDLTNTTIDLTSGPGKLFQQTCSRCHALPAPSQHTPDEWPVVVERMKGNMRNMGKSVPTESELNQIIGFLQKNASMVEIK